MKFEIKQGDCLELMKDIPDGTQATVDTYYWGDYFESTVDNVVDFSAWLSEQELSEEIVKALKNDGKYTLICLIKDYNWQLEEADEN